MVSRNELDESDRLIRQALAAMIASLQAQDEGDHALAELARDQSSLFLRRAAIIERKYLAQCEVRG